MKGMVFLLMALAYIPAWAQHNNRSGRDLQFRFGNPGARSLAFGGAFIGLADDATAPVANPAGAVRTAKRSMAFELNYNQVENNIPFASGNILQTNLFEFDYQFQGTSAPENTFQIPYLAVVVPKNNWRYGFFLHQQANFRRAYENEAVLYCHLLSNGYPNCSDQPNPESFPPSSEYLDLNMLNGGLTASYALTSSFSLGLSLFYSRLDYRADSILVNSQVVGDATVSRTAHSDDSALGLIGGLLWQATSELSMGLTYKYQPEFTYQAALNSSRPVPRVPDNFTTTAIFKIPDSVGFGISVAPMDQMVINMDANRVFYSQITDELLDFSQISTGQGAITQTMADVTEIHVGLEYVYLGLANPLSLRLGYWLDPYHAPVNNVEDSQILDGQAGDPNIRDIFFLHLFEKDENHYSMGLGYTFSDKFQCDMAVESADTSQNVTLSGIYRF